MARHRLPAYIHARNLRAALGFTAVIVGDQDKTVACDAAELTFVDPSGLCIFAATCHRLAHSGKKLEVENIPESIAGHLARMVGQMPNFWFIFCLGMPLMGSCHWQGIAPCKQPF